MIQAKFGIDEIYIHSGLEDGLLEKINQRAALCLDAEDNIARKYVSHDMILIFYKTIPERSQIYRFLRFLDQDAKKEDFIKSNTILNEEELFSAIKLKKIVLITHKNLTKKTYTPA